MKRYLILCLALAGCDPKQIERDGNAREMTSGKGSVYTVEYEGCQYVVIHTASSNRSITHKGNCPNPIHHYQAEKP